MPKFADDSLKAIAATTVTVRIALVVSTSCVIGILGCRAPRAAQRDGPPSLAVVQLKEPGPSGAADSLRAGQDVLAVLPQTKSEIWRIDAPSRLPILRADARVVFVEPMTGGTIAAIPVETVSLSEISADDRQVVARLTEGAPPNSFRVTAARPTGLTADLLESSLAGLVAIPLLNGDTPLFTRASLDRIGTDAFSWTGQMANEQSDATLVVRTLGITGNIRYQNATYNVWPLSSGRHLIRRYGPLQFPPDHPPDNPRD